MIIRALCFLAVAAWFLGGYGGGWAILAFAIILFLYFRESP